MIIKMYGKKYKTKYLLKNTIIFKNYDYLMIYNKILKTKYLFRIKMITIYYLQYQF